MPPSRKTQDDPRADALASTARDKHATATGHAKKGKHTAAAAATAAATAPSAATAAAGSGAAHQQYGVTAREQPLANADANAGGAAPGAGQGMAWHAASLSLLDNYRVAHSLPTPPAFTSPRNEALLTNPGIGRRSPAMAKRKEKRRIGRDQLAMAVRRNFNSAAVNETDVVVEFVYKVGNLDKALRMRSGPASWRKP